MIHARVHHIASLLSHLALYPAAYTLGVYLLTVLSLNLRSPQWTTISFILIVAHACYLLDRVKLSDSRQDPADALALPDRALFFASHSTPLRVVCVVELIVSSVLGYLILPALALIPILSLIGVFVYAGRGAAPSKPRFKDLPTLKSIFIASAHLALAVGVAWSDNPSLIDHPRAHLVWILTGVWLIVCADAIICDLDDMDSDALYATRSLPVLIGSAGAWRSALAMLLIGGVCLLMPQTFALHQFCVSVMVVLSAIPTIRRNNRRDLIDARLLLIVLVGLLMR
jgi:4-hydroxybenzoate polyprenyltransferase